MWSWSCPYNNFNRMLILPTEKIQCNSNCSQNWVSKSFLSNVFSRFTILKFFYKLWWTLKIVPNPEHLAIFSQLFSNLLEFFYKVHVCLKYCWIWNIGRYNVNKNTPVSIMFGLQSPTLLSDFLLSPLIKYTKIFKRKYTSPNCRFWIY